MKARCQISEKAALHVLWHVGEQAHHKLVLGISYLKRLARHDQVLPLDAARFVDKSRTYRDSKGETFTYLPESTRTPLLYMVASCTKFKSCCQHDANIVQ